MLTNVGGALMHHAVLLHSSPSAACGEMLVIENLIENPIGNPIIGPKEGNPIGNTIRCFYQILILLYYY